MKKVFKFVAGTAAVAGVVCGAVYAFKKFFGAGAMGKDDDFDDDFDDGFDDIDDDEDSDDREYVTLDMEKEDNSEEKEEEADDAEVTDKTEAETE